MEDHELEILKRLDEQDKKLDAIYKSAEKTRKIFLWTLIIALVVTVLPLVGMVFAIPFFFSTFSSMYAF